MKCPGGRLLTNGNVVSLFQACFRIGHYQTERGKGVSGAARRPPGGAFGSAGRTPGWALRRALNGRSTCALHALGLNCGVVLHWCLASYACEVRVAGEAHASTQLAHATCSTSLKELRHVRYLGERRVSAKCRQTRAC